MSGSRRRGNSRSRAKKPAAVRDFWGATPDEVEFEPIRPSNDPSAMVRSLGPAPLAGRENVSEHYFAAVYDKAAALATALGATVGLVDLSTTGDDD